MISSSELIQGIARAQRLALARSITLIERNDPRGQEVLQGVWHRVGRAHRIGITGSPGCGKSTLVRALTKSFVDGGARVGIIAVDPSSPFTGGALLGDRIRMGDVAASGNVFYRSMASRGALGGLAVATQDAADLVDAYGVDYLLLETVGVGQSEVEVADAADTSVVVIAPGAGDGMQAMKAGLIEIADLIVVNKADREGVEQTCAELQAMLCLGEKKAASRQVPIIRTIATLDSGIDEFEKQIARHYEYQQQNNVRSSLRAGQLKRRIRQCVVDSVQKKFLDEIPEEQWAQYLNEVQSGTETPGGIARRIVGEYRNIS
jgi:GTPase